MQRFITMSLFQNPLSEQNFKKYIQIWKTKLANWLESRRRGLI